MQPLSFVYTQNAYKKGRVRKWGDIDITENMSYNSSVAKLNPFRYRGYYYDTETGLYYLNSRYYDPSIGRFLNADDISYIQPTDINGLNLYAYCGNNPIMFTDASGTSWWDDIWKGLVALAAAIVIVGVVALVTVATGGTAMPVVIGAIAGGVISGTVSIGTQYLTTGSVNWEQFLLDISIGGVLGAFGGSAIGQLGMTAASFGVEFAGSLASDWIAGESLDFLGAFTTAVFAAGFAFIGGGGAQSGRLGARQAALATKKQILTKNANKGYRSINNFKFALKSNAKRIKRVTQALNKASIRDILSKKNVGYGLMSTILQGLLL